MEQQKPQRYFFLDFARAVAITFVTAFHLWRFFGNPEFTLGPLKLHQIAASGAIGVDIFFVVSGYAMMMTWQKHGDRADRAIQFYSDRLWRIYPPYLVALIVWGLISVTLLPRPISSGDWLSHLTMTHTLFPAYFFGISGVLWSLAVEAHFYLIFPLIVVLNWRWKVPVALAGLAYAFVSSYYLPAVFPLRWNALAYLPLFLLGMSLFEARERGFRLPVKMAVPILLVILLTMTALPVVGVNVFPRILLATAFAIPLLLWSPKLPALLGSTVSAIGLASYSIYLYNYGFQLTKKPLIDGLPGVVFYFAAIYLFGMFMRFAVEKNVPRVRKWLSARRQLALAKT